MAMGGFLGGLANLGEIYGYQQQAQDAETKRRQAQLQLQLEEMQTKAAQRQMQAQAAALRGLTADQSPPVGAGQQSLPAMPQAAPMPAGGGGPMPGPPPGAAPPPGGPAMPPGGQPAMPQARPMPGPQGGGGFGGSLDIPSLARRIKAANPGIDESTLFQAVVQSQHLLQPAAQLELRAQLLGMQQDMKQQSMLIQEQRLRDAEHNSANRLEMDRLKFERTQAEDSRRDNRAQQHMDQTRWYQEQRVKLTQEGQAGVSARSQQRQQLALDKMAYQDGRRDLIQDTRWKMQAIGDDTKSVNAKISELLHGRDLGSLTAQEKQGYQKLVDQREKLRGEAEQTISAARRKQIALPSLKDLVNGKGKIDLPEPDDIADDAPAKAGATAGSGKYKVGDIIDQGGKKYRVTGGDLNDPDVEPVQ